ncbi:hypothetical protein AXG93_3658s1120 [Marchantia polymorpha subsp. ruderalis]|uniref:Uncharacterized protein n=1 Tax=Marchantia polymorpha subsp. ruderalis TaxID=1480154 RepID=A0A176VKG9_MARPO|nr:hypothetical protein AXG93_3658s1120 [Marchantia polymorpha subsp. ruderalis]
MGNELSLETEDDEYEDRVRVGLGRVRIRVEVVEHMSHRNHHLRAGSRRVLMQWVEGAESPTTRSWDATRACCDAPSEDGASPSSCKLDGHDMRAERTDTQHSHPFEFELCTQIDEPVLAIGSRRFRIDLGSNSQLGSERGRGLWRRCRLLRIVMHARTHAPIEGSDCVAALGLIDRAAPGKRRILKRAQPMASDQSVNRLLTCLLLRALLPQNSMWDTSFDSSHSQFPDSTRTRPGFSG